MHNCIKSLLFFIIRFGKTGTLSVEETNSSQKPIMKTATSPGTATVLDINQSTRMFIGGLGGQIKVKKVITMMYYLIIVHLIDFRVTFHSQFCEG